jgi:hypothetical protein
MRMANHAVVLGSAWTGGTGTQGRDLRSRALVSVDGANVRCPDSATDTVTGGHIWGATAPDTWPLRQTFTA